MPLPPRPIEKENLLFIPMHSDNDTNVFQRQMPISRSDLTSFSVFSASILNRACILKTDIILSAAPNTKPKFVLSLNEFACNLQ